MPHETQQERAEKVQTAVDAAAKGMSWDRSNPNPTMKCRYTYVLNHGGHEDTGPVEYTDRSGNVKVKITNRIFKAGDIIHTDQQLHGLNGPGGMTGKFELLTQDGSAYQTAREPSPFDKRPGETQADYALRLMGLATKEQQKAVADKQAKMGKPPEQMTEKELEQFAADEEIDLKGASNREGKLKRVRAAAGQA